jgi:hypothetical protein
VTLNRSGAAPLTGAFDQSGLWFGLPKPLDKGETVHATQAFPRCERIGDNGPDQVVGPPSGLTAPHVVEPLCVGAVSVRIVGLNPGATIHLTAGGTTYTGVAPQRANWTDLFVSALASGTVAATQEACSVTSDPSNTVTIQQ